jgi:hypothetical protein
VLYMYVKQTNVQQDKGALAGANQPSMRMQASTTPGGRWSSSPNRLDVLGDHLKVGRAKDEGSR